MKTVFIKNIPVAGEVLYTELQNGFYIEASEGTSIRRLINVYCRIPDDYCSNKIKTIFHNSNPVDSPDDVKISYGSVCAISGAMPGLVGAMMRIGSPYASMRESITEKGNDVSETGKTVLVRIKLFNVILSDLGEKFISSGVILSVESVLSVIGRIEEKIGGSFTLFLDGERLSSSKKNKLQDKMYIVKQC